MSKITVPAIVSSKEKFTRKGDVFVTGDSCAYIEVSKAVWAHALIVDIKDQEMRAEDLREAATLFTYLADKLDRDASR